jgi:hypothetical protein
LELGTTFKLLDEGPLLHLWMIISDPKLNRDQVVLVNFTSWQCIHDQTCIVSPGEHPYLAHRSVVYYPEPMIKTLKNLEQSDRVGLLQYHENLSPQLLEKIQRGALCSPYIPIKAKRIIAEQFPNILDEPF